MSPFLVLKNSIDFHKKENRVLKSTVYWSSGSPWNLFLAQNPWYSTSRHQLQHPFPPCQSWENTLVMATRPVWVSPTRSAHHCYLPRWTEWQRTITAPPQIGHIVNLSTGPLTWKWGVKCPALAWLWASCHSHATHWACQPAPLRECSNMSSLKATSHNPFAELLQIQVR